ncbi:hypothetical protein DsansV1_C02g0021021 [Dioscorea sansibarensis]
MKRLGLWCHVSMLILRGGVWFLQLKIGLSTYLHPHCVRIATSLVIIDNCNSQTI